MGRMKPDEGGVNRKAKPSGKEKLSVSAMLVSMWTRNLKNQRKDMQSIDALADAFDKFTGGVVLFSHDSRLMSRVCEDEERSEIWVAENGTFEFFQGMFEEYKEELIKEIRAEVDD